MGVLVDLKGALYPRDFRPVHTDVSASPDGRERVAGFRAVVGADVDHGLVSGVCRCDLVEYGNQMRVLGMGEYCFSPVVGRDE